MERLAARQRIMCMRHGGAPPTWIHACIVAGAGMFIVALIVSAVFDPSIRVLHTLQALIYVAVIVLTHRRSAWGYGAGFLIAGFWNYVNLFVTNFIAAGLQQVAGVFRAGRIERPDLLIAVVAGAGHFLLMGGCLAGFLRTGPGTRAWLRFAAGGVITIAYFVAIIIATGPQYIRLLKRIIGIS